MINSKQTVFTIDCHFTAPKIACAYLMTENGKAAFIENNTQFAIPYLLQALKDHNVPKENVEYIIITHVHLDHAGGTFKLAQECPNATVLCHEQAAKHMINPERLIEGAKAVYGEAIFNAQYGTIEPVPENRVRIVKDNEIIKFGSRELRFIYTLGHAKHHTCIYDSGTNGIFTGDSFGIAYPATQTGRLPFIFPTSSPADFDPAEALISIDKIIATGADKAYLTHFGTFTDLKYGADVLRSFINDINIIINNAIDIKDGELYNYCRKGIDKIAAKLAHKCGIAFADIKDIIEPDLYLNANGIAIKVQKIRKS